MTSMRAIRARFVQDRILFGRNLPILFVLSSDVMVNELEYHSGDVFKHRKTYGVVLALDFHSICCQLCQ